MLDKKKIIILSALCFVTALALFIPGYLKIKQLTRQNIELERQITEIKGVNKRLALEQERLKTDPLYLEKVAREKLGMVRKGEAVYKILSPLSPQSKATQDSAER